MVSNCFVCGIEIISTTRPKKFCGVACRVKAHRVLTGTVPGLLPAKKVDPSNSPNQKDIYDYLPFHIAVYMPVQPWQTVAQVKGVTSGKAIDDSDCKF